MGAMSAVDLLAFGPHPDDVEIGMGGTLALEASRGARVGLCDLTRGERGSNGTPDQRVAEAEAAAAVLGAAWRVNLGLPDGGLAVGAGPGPRGRRARAAARGRPWSRSRSSATGIPITSPRTRCSCAPSSTRACAGSTRPERRGVPRA